MGYCCGPGGIASDASICDTVQQPATEANGHSDRAQRLGSGSGRSGLLSILGKSAPGDAGGQGIGRGMRSKQGPIRAVVPAEPRMPSSAPNAARNLHHMKGVLQGTAALIHLDVLLSYHLH